MSATELDAVGNFFVGSFLGMAPNTTGKSPPGVREPLTNAGRILPFGALKTGPMATALTTSGPPATRNPKRESERLRSFRRRWTVDFLDPKDLAKYGFYYTNEFDIVRCAFCGVEIGYWEKGDDPKSEHLKWSPDCDFANGKECGNVPLEECATEEDGNEDEDDPQCYDTCGPFRIEIRPFSKPERVPREINRKSLWQDLEHLGVSKTCGPSNPRYSTYESRLKTFDTWPADHKLRPEALAEAGFYYLRYHDNTVCFHCGGGLKNWEADDDPWVEHARWFDKCGFVNMQKGKEFVKEVLAKKKAIIPATEVIALCKGNSGEFNVTESSSSSSSSSSSTTEEAQVAATSNSEEKIPVTSCSSFSPCSSTTKEIELCRICFSREREIVFLPCGHFVSCTNCAVSLTKCAVCRKPFEATCRAYLS